MEKLSKHLVRGIITENPTFVQVLGTCPTLAVTTTAINGLGMGLSVCFVLIFSNLIISLLRKFIPEKIRIPAYIVVIATFVTIIDLFLQAFFYDTLYQSLGLFIPLIVVNCIILGRAEVYASKHAPLDSMMDGLSMGIGFTLALTLMGIIREFLGAGTLFGLPVFGESFQAASILTMAPGGFFVFGFSIAIFRGIVAKAKSRKEQRQ